MNTRTPLVAYVIFALVLAGAVAIAGDEESAPQAPQADTSSAAASARDQSHEDTLAGAAPPEEARARRRNPAEDAQPVAVADRKALMAGLLAAWYLSAKSE